MLSIRHYTPEALERITKGREILLEQKTRSTIRFVVREDPSVAARPSPLKGRKISFFIEFHLQAEFSPPAKGECRRARGSYLSNISRCPGNRY